MDVAEEPSKHPHIVNRYAQLRLDSEPVLLRYVFLDADGKTFRAKSKQVIHEPRNLDEVPAWSICGQTCGYMKRTEFSDCWLRPVFMCRDPFRGRRCKLIWCVPESVEISASIRRLSCAWLLNQFQDAGKSSNKMRFIIRQPFIVIDAKNDRPLGWPMNGYPGPASQYCGVGVRTFGRDISEAFYRACLNAGVPLTSINAGRVPAAWSFEIGPEDGLKIGNCLWMARYILHMVGESFGCAVRFDNQKLGPIRWDEGMSITFGSSDQLAKTIAAESIAALSATNIYSDQGVDHNPTSRVRLLTLSGSDYWIEDGRPSTDADPYLVVERIIRVLKGVKGIKF